MIGSRRVLLTDHTLFWANAQEGIVGTNPVYGDVRTWFMFHSASDFAISKMKGEKQCHQN